MTIQLGIGVAAFVAAQLCAFWAMSVTHKMLFQLNSKTEARNTLSPYLWWFGKYVRLRREYRRVLPNGELIQKLTKIEVLFVSLMIIVVWAVFSR